MPTRRPTSAPGRRRVRHGARAVAAVALLLSSGCTAQASTDRTVTVFAAASLRSAFAAEAREFERTHPGTEVALSFAGSQSLVAQVRQGAPADVLATADATTVEAVRASLQGPPRVFAHNRLAIVTAPGNPERISSLADLSRDGLRVVLAAPSVPVGRASAAALGEAGVTVRPVSLDDSVSGVVGKVRLGEADAGIAYATDLGHGVDGVALEDTTTELLIGTLTPGGAQFMEFVLSAAGQAVLREHGFT